MGTIASTSAPAASDTRRWIALGAVLGGTFMAILDMFIVNVAAPHIQSSLHAGSGTLQLIVAGYTLAYAVVLITGARLGDDHGHRKLFLIGLAGFTITSVLCGIAPSAFLLIIARILQGASSGIMVPQVLSIIQVRFEGPERNRAIGMYAFSLGLASISGQIIGGLLLRWNPFDLGWRAAFLVNIPIGIATLVVGWRVIDESKATAARPIDPAGIALLSVGVLALVLPLVEGRERGWPLWTWMSLVLAVFLLATFIRLQKRASAAGRPGLLDLEVFRNRDFRWGLASIFFLQTTNGVLFLALTVHLQSGLGFTPLHSGLTYVPEGLAFGALSLVLRRLPARMQPSLTPIGLGILAIGYAALGLAARHGWSAWWGVPLMVVIGIGQSGYVPQVALLMRRVRPEHAASASGLLATTVQLGTLLGIATIGTLFFALRDDRVDSGGALRDASSHAFSMTLIGLGVVVVVSLAAFLRVDRRESADVVSGAVFVPAE